MSFGIESAISDFGKSAKRKLSNPAATGQPEDQLRAPFEQLLEDVSRICGFHSGAVVAVGEASQRHLKTRPDYSITVNKALAGFVELKAPGKGANPARFKDPHDKEQWERLRSLPNLLYTDGNSFGLWQDGKLVGSVLSLSGDIETAGEKLAPPPGLLLLFESFLRWKPVPPRSARELAHTTARLCALLRDEVAEQLGLKSQALTDLATDWRKLLFPEATDERFADGYAQAVTFGMLMARAKGIVLGEGLHKVAAELMRSSTLIGAALRLLTDNVENQETLKTALSTLTRVLDAVDWKKVTKGEPDAWLYFYEEFLDVYDKKLRKQTGSYYTPPEVVGAMVSLVDEVLRSKRFGLRTGLASPSVTLADPAMGTGTFLLGVLRRIAQTVESDEGPGAVSGVIQAALARLIGFEIQLGPFAVAQLRILAEVVELAGSASSSPLRIFVTNTLGDPYESEEYFPSMLAALGATQTRSSAKSPSPWFSAILLTKRKQWEAVAGSNMPAQTKRTLRRFRLGCLQPNGMRVRIVNISGTSKSISGAGPHGRFSTTIPPTTPASFASSPWQDSSRGLDSRKCATTCDAPAMTSGSSTAPRTVINPR